MLPAETPSEAGAEGILMDLEFARVKSSSLDTTSVPPIRKPSGGMTAPTVFGPDVIRGAVMTVSLSHHHGAVYLLIDIVNLREPHSSWLRKSCCRPS
jgi:hypothetical protein